MPVWKKVILGVFCVVFSILLIGCEAKKTTTMATDPLESLHSGSSIDGVALSNGAVDLLIDPVANETALTEDILITNTTEINVSISDLKENEIVDVYLYDAEHMGVIVATTRLSDTERSFTFSHLKSTVGYRICAESINLLASKYLKITD